MVNQEAQLYTMEGIAAGILMLITVYLVLGTTQVYTSGDSHISDMQFEQAASDILRVIDTPKNITAFLSPTSKSDLERVAETMDAAAFYTTFDFSLCYGDVVASDTAIAPRSFNVNASIWSRTGTTARQELLMGAAPAQVTEPDIRVTHFIHLSSQHRVVLVEVDLWHV